MIIITTMTHGLSNGRKRISSNCMRNLRSTQNWTKQIKIKNYISVLYHLINQSIIIRIKQYRMNRYYTSVEMVEIVNNVPSLN